MLYLTFSYIHFDRLSRSRSSRTRSSLVQNSVVCWYLGETAISLWLEVFRFLEIFVRETIGSDSLSTSGVIQEQKQSVLLWFDKFFTLEQKWNMLPQGLALESFLSLMFLHSSGQFFQNWATRAVRFFHSSNPFQKSVWVRSARTSSQRPDFFRKVRSWLGRIPRPLSSGLCLFIFARSFAVVLEIPACVKCGSS